MKPKPSSATAESRASLRKVPGDAGWPVVGDTFKYLSGKLITRRDRYDRYGPVSWGKAFGIKLVMVCGPEACGTVLLNQDQAYASGPGWSYIIGPFFTRGLMLLDFEEHAQHRRILQQAFTSARLSEYLDPMNAVIALNLQKWSTRQGFQFYPALKQMTLDIATRTFLSAELGPQSDRINQAFTDCVLAGTAVLRFAIPGGRWARGLAGRKVLADYLRAKLPHKRSGPTRDLFSALCHARSEEGEQFTDEDVINHMIFLLMAAHDTTTITMTAMAYYLARYPKWQERCRAESLGLGKTLLNYEELDQLVALDWVMREAMRLITPVPGLMRFTVKDTELLGYFIPKGSFVALNLGATHRLREYWPDPERFDPERFAPERREDRVHRHAWLPFGGGVHKCIGLYFGGMQIKAAMHQLLLGYRFSVAPSYQMPIDWTSLPRPRDGLPVHLEKR